MFNSLMISLDKAITQLGHYRLWSDGMTVKASGREKALDIGVLSQPLFDVSLGKDWPIL